MTLVYRAKKPQWPTSHSQLGPGQYFTKKQNSKQKNNDPMFLSQSKRYDQYLENQIQNLVGPGQYQPIPIQKKKCTVNCGAVFNSKVKRFEDDTKNNQDQIEEQTPYLPYWKNEQQKKYQKQKLCKGTNPSKSIPSIPTWQASYGYKIDQNTRQLVHNVNPNILINHTKKSHNQDWLDKGPGYYFIKQKKPIKGSKWKSEIPKDTQLSPQTKNIQKCDHLVHKKYNSKWKSTGNLITSKQARFTYQEKPSRNILQQRNLQRIFGQYTDNKNIEELEDKKREKLLQKITENRKNVGQRKNVQCFATKQSRFTDKNGGKNNILQQSLPSKQNQAINQLKKSNCSASFGSKQLRFMEQKRQRLGPGCYFQNTQFSGKKGVTIKFNASRFQRQVPALQSLSHTFQNQKVNSSKRSRIPQRMFHVSELKQGQAQPSQQIQNSIVSLYQNYGREVNYYIKQQKKQKPKVKNPKNQVLKQLFANEKDLYQTAKKHIYNGYPSDLQRHLQDHQFRSKAIFKPLKKNYNFKKNDNKEGSLGPGSFDIASSLEKKTHNVTYT